MTGINLNLAKHDDGSPAWEVRTVRFTGDADYPFSLNLLNHYKGGGVAFWRVPDFSPLAFDLSRARFTGLSNLL